MMAKFNEGDTVSVTAKDECVPYGTVLTVKAGPIGSGAGGNYYFHEYDDVILGRDLERITVKPKKSARITALETQVAALEAKVSALEKAGKYPLTNRFNQEAREVDAILADIKRKAKPKPTLEALLAMYPSSKLSANERRADVIRYAKAYLEDAKVVPDHGGKKAYLSQLADSSIGYYCNVEFHVNNDKRTVVALLRWRFNGAVKAKGIAKCDPDDVFNADIGKAIALARALGVEVPTEFVKAVQPTEHVLGQRVHLTKASPNMRITTNRTRAYEKLVRLCFVKETYPNSRILDDSNAVYE